MISMLWFSILVFQSKADIDAAVKAANDYWVDIGGYDSSNAPYGVHIANLFAGANIDLGGASGLGINSIEVPRKDEKRARDLLRKDAVGRDLAKPVWHGSVVPVKSRLSSLPIRLPSFVVSSRDFQKLAKENPWINSTATRSGFYLCAKKRYGVYQVFALEEKVNGGTAWTAFWVQSTGAVTSNRSDLDWPRK